MIRTDIDIKDALYDWVSSSNLASSISGRVYNDQRPLNSDVEDVVIAIIGRDAGTQIQEAIANINVYVKDVRRGREAIEDKSRLRTLCTLAAECFEYYHFGYGIFSLESQEVLKAYDIDWHVINNRIRIRYNNE